MLGDRSLGTDDKYPVDFLGDTAEFPLGPFRMASKAACEAARLPTRKWAMGATVAPGVILALLYAAIFARRPRV